MLWKQVIEVSKIPEKHG